MRRLYYTIRCKLGYHRYAEWEVSDHDRKYFIPGTNVLRNPLCVDCEKLKLKGKTQKQYEQKRRQELKAAGCVLSDRKIREENTSNGKMLKR